MKKQDRKNSEYAAIYARTSGTQDSNSIPSQIAECTEMGVVNNLIIYDSYVDKVSGKSLCPEEREGYKKLLADAKAGCFRTLIIYRYDRLVRNYDDWITTSSILKKLGIKVLLADKTQPPCSENPNDNFLTNLMVLFSDFEPDYIKQRVDKGKENLRKRGIYNPGIVPFAYEKIAKKTGDINFSYRGIPVCKEFIVYIFREFCDKVEDFNNDYTELIKDIHESSLQLVEQLEVDIKEESRAREKELICNDNKNFNTFVKEIENYNKMQKVDGIKSIKNYFFFNIEKNTNRYSNTIKLILKNNIYSGFLLLNSNPEKNALKGFTINKSGKLEFSSEKFIKTQNVEPLIDEKLFIKVYSALIKIDIEKTNSFNPFLLKEKLECKCKSSLILQQNGLITCSNKCFLLFFDEFIREILNEVVQSALKYDDSAFKNFEYAIERKLMNLNIDLEKVSQKKGEVLKEFITKNEIDIDRMNEFIINRNKDIAFKKRIINSYRIKLSALKEFKKEVKENGKENGNEKEKGIKLLVEYIIKNEKYFGTLLDNIISKIIIGVDYDKKEFETTINYEFKADQNRNIYKGLY